MIAEKGNALHSGKTHAGLGSENPIFDAGFEVTGKIQRTSSDSFNIIGILLVKYICGFLATCKMIPPPNFFQRFTLGGNLVAIAKSNFLLEGFISGIERCFLEIIGNVKVHNPRHVGKTHVGLGTNMLVADGMYAIKGKLMAVCIKRLQIAGDIIHHMEKIYTSYGVIYTPNLINCFIIKAFKLSNGRARFLANGTLRQDAMRVFRMIGNLTTYNFDRFFSKGFILENSYKFFESIGTIGRPYSARMTAKGFVHALGIRYLKTVGICKANGIFKCLVKAGIGISGEGRFNITGVCRQIGKSMFGAIGNLLNDHGDWFITIRGMLSPATRAFVFAVPYRMQQFITDRRWFR